MELSEQHLGRRVKLATPDPSGRAAQFGTETGVIVALIPLSASDQAFYAVQFDRPVEAITGGYETGYLSGGVMRAGWEHRDGCVAGFWPRQLDLVDAADDDDDDNLPLD
jgi:hypothetical protein